MEIQYWGILKYLFLVCCWAHLTNWKAWNCRTQACNKWILSGKNCSICSSVHQTKKYFWLASTNEKGDKTSKFWRGFIFFFGNRHTQSHITTPKQFSLIWFNLNHETVLSVFFLKENSRHCAPKGELPEVAMKTDDKQLCSHQLAGAACVNKRRQQRQGAVSWGLEDYRGEARLAFNSSKMPGFFFSHNNMTELNGKEDCKLAEGKVHKKKQKAL